MQKGKWVKGEKGHQVFYFKQLASLFWTFLHFPSKTVLLLLKNPVFTYNS